MFNKKGELPSDGRYVAVIILLIALFMVMYLLFIPPDEREKLLSQPSSAGSGGNTDVIAAREEVLVADPGVVSPEKGFGTQHQLSPINLFLKTEPKTLSLAQSLNVKQGWFQAVSPALNFDLEGTDVKKVSLFFSVEQPSGELRLFINGNQFFAEEMTNPGIKVIDVPLSFIKDKNKIDFKVSTPGIAFWHTNSYTLKDIGLKVDFERINTQESRQFAISKIEKSAADHASLSFVQFCNAPLPRGKTLLRIYVNDHDIVTGNIGCASTRQSYEFDPAFLVEGQNNIRMMLDEGEFFFNEVKVETTSQQAQFPTYTFVLNNDQFKSLASSKKKGSLDFVFGVAPEKRTGKIQVNGKDFTLNTNQNALSVDITPALVEGTNTLRLIPSSIFEIVKLKVTLA
ncbi:hypothetical protein HZB00_00305 [Candidatus Woesearchaeota archaeon]|nr:hypothetical protein [Candidatus Woesearchaeota archaeon]